MKTKISDLTCIILAGGLGTRIRHLLPENTPKFLTPINGKPFAYYLLTYLKEQGIKHVILATSHLSSAIEEFIDTSPIPYINIMVSYSSMILGPTEAVKRTIKEF